LGQPMSTICPLTNEPCFATEHGRDACSDKPTLDDAAKCIKNIRALNLEMAKEIAVLDEMLEAIKERKSILKDNLN
jgi:hypothetical protein